MDGFIKDIDNLINGLSENDLKPCPFCGGKAETDYGWFDCNYCGVHCQDCDAYVYDYNSPEKAIEKWNKRINEE